MTWEMQNRSSDYRPPAADAEAHRNLVGAQLQAMTVELVDLALFGKQAQWNVQGPHFTALQSQLGELVDSWRALADEVAERAVALGFAPDAQAHTIVATSPIEPCPPGPMADTDVIDEVAHRLGVVVERTRERGGRVASVDPVTEDLILGLAQRLERQLWTVRVQGAPS